jgi:glycosyltransferase involved in cell wall biosynthesis
MLRDEGFTSRMLVANKITNDITVEKLDVGRRLRFSKHYLTQLSKSAIAEGSLRLSRILRKPYHTNNPILQSTCIRTTGIALHPLVRSCSLVHLHWIGRQPDKEIVSIEELTGLSKPIVWTLHDQWAFCGAEHYTFPPGRGEKESTDRRFELGYTPASRTVRESGHDLNRHTWLRKRRAWKRPMHIVCPSHWLAGCARRSALMGSWPVEVIPNPIDLRVWAPWDQAQARTLLDLPRDRLLVLFGAVGGTEDPRKGADLLLEALQILRMQLAGEARSEIELVVFGQSRPQQPPDLGFPIHYAGRVWDDLRLRLLYAAADVMVVPSRQEAFGQTASEAHACGTPVVAFRTGGLPDIIDDRVTGALAEPFDPVSLAAAIRWVLEDPHRRCLLGSAARQRAEQLWNPARIAGMYGNVYRQAMEHHKLVWPP